VVDLNSEPLSDRAQVAAAEKISTQCLIDLGELIIVDSIMMFPDGAGFHLWSHDMHGPLPEVVVLSSGDAFRDKEAAGREAYKLNAIARLRDELARFLPGGELLPVTTIDARAVVGLKAGPKTWLSDGKDFLEAYHELHCQVIRRTD